MQIALAITILLLPSMVNAQQQQEASLHPQREAADTITTTVGKAFFCMGCFWGVEASFARVDGVLKTRVGYSGGNTPPLYGVNYHNMADHMEAVEVQFDPSKCSFYQLL